MRRNARLWVVIPLYVLISVILVLYGLWQLIDGNHYRQPFVSLMYYVVIGTGVLLLILTPVLIWGARRAANKRAEMEEMLEDYRQRKKQNRP